jgi:hypothetical protein
MFSPLMVPTIWRCGEDMGRMAMRTAGMFVLHVEPETAVMPVRLSIALTGTVSDHLGVLHVTPQCMTLDELEGYINGLQDELDVVRAEARRTFATTTGHA